MVNCLCGESPDCINKTINSDNQKLITLTNTALLQPSTIEQKYNGSLFDQGRCYRLNGENGYQPRIL